MWPKVPAVARAVPVCTVQRCSGQSRAEVQPGLRWPVCAGHRAASAQECEDSFLLSKVPLLATPAPWGSV